MHVAQEEHFLIAGRNAKIFQPLYKEFGGCLKKLDILLPYNSHPYSLAFTSKCENICIHKIFTWKFIKSFIEIFQLLEATTIVGPLVGKWINKMGYIQTMDLFGSKKKAIQGFLSNHRGTFNLYYYVKEAKPRRLHTI